MHTDRSELGPEQTSLATGRGLQVQFTWQGDRYAHTICAASEPASCLLASQEGNPDDLWPASPPFQQLHIETRPNSNVAFLVGMAGSTHWSASFELDADGKTLSVDVACRAARAPDDLVSTYRVQLPCEYCAATSRVSLTAAQRNLLLETCVATQLAASGSELGHIYLRPAPSERDTPRTIRWSYKITDES